MPRRSSGRTIVGVRSRSVTPRAPNDSPSARTRASGGAGWRRKGSNTISVAPASAARSASSMRYTCARRANGRAGAGCSRHRCDAIALAICVGALGALCLGRPVAPLKQLLDRGLAQVIQLADRQKQIPSRANGRRSPRARTASRRDGRTVRGASRGPSARFAAGDERDSLRTSTVSSPLMNSALSVRSDASRRPVRRGAPSAASERSADSRVACPRALEQAGLRCAHDAPAHRHRPCACAAPARRRRVDASACALVTAKPIVGPPTAPGRSKPRPSPTWTARDDVDDQLAALAADHFADVDAAIVGLLARDVLASRRDRRTCRR